MVANDGYPGDYSHMKIATSPDAVGGAAFKSGNGLAACSRTSIKLKLTRYKHHAITRVKMYVDHHLVMTRRGRGLSLTLPGLAGTRLHTLSRL
jgi:hypothetical protein